MVFLLGLWRNDTFRRPECPCLEYIYILIACIFLVDGLAFSLLDSDYNASYWIPCYVLVLCFLAVQYSGQPHRIILITAVMAVCSVSTILQNIKTPLRARTGLEEAALWLRDHGYSKGYAQFWDADASTEFTDGALELWALSDINNLHSLSWGQAYAHFETMPEDPFLLLRKGEPFDYYDSVQLVHETEDYYIFQFPEGIPALEPNT